jgi:ribonuclease P protein component
VLTSGSRRRTGRLDIYWRPNGLGHPRLGVVVSRYGRSAVARNRLRRCVREHIRRFVLPQIPPLDVIVRPGVTAYAAAADDLATDLARWLASLHA